VIRRVSVSLSEDELKLVDRLAKYLVKTYGVTPRKARHCALRGALTRGLSAYIQDIRVSQ
jgi:hypothetical protein